MKTSGIAFVFVSVLAAGCASTSVVQTGTAFPARAENCSLRVVNTFPAPDTYTEIGVIHGKSGGSAFHGQKLQDILPDMKAAACELGADALVLKSSSESSYFQMWGGKVGEAEAVAIKMQSAR